MTIRLFELDNDKTKILSFLEGSALAHGINPMNQEWFLWKFFGSPYGKAIIACAFDGERIAGSVAYGRVPISYRGETYNGALAYENYVHPEYQGQGLFKKLISKITEAAEAEGVIDLLWVFPNTNAIAGYLRMGWIESTMPQYRICVNHWFRVIPKIRDLKTPFKTQDSNLPELPPPPNGDFQAPQKYPPNVIAPVWNADYMKWRFFTYPVAKYCISDNERFFASARIGFRGRLKEAQILTVSPKSETGYKVCFKAFLKELRAKEDPDIFGISTTQSHPLSNCLSGFIKVPSQGHFCCYIPKTSRLKDILPPQNLEIALSTIDFHTY